MFMQIRKGHHECLQGPSRSPSIHPMYPKSAFLTSIDSKIRPSQLGLGQSRLRLGSHVTSPLFLLLLNSPFVLFLGSRLGQSMR